MKCMIINVFMRLHETEFSVWTFKLKIRHHRYSCAPCCEILWCWLGWQGLVMNASCRTESINGNVHASFGRLTAEYTV